MYIFKVLFICVKMYTPSEIVQFSFFFFDKPRLCIWSRTLRGSEAAQSNFLTFLCVLNVQTVLKKKLHLQFSVEVFLHKNEWK